VQCPDWRNFQGVKAHSTSAFLEQEGHHDIAPIFCGEVKSRLARPRLHGIDQRSRLLRPTGPLQQHLHGLWWSGNKL
jgi:hypothetical protein